MNKKQTNLTGVQTVAQELFDKFGKITASMLIDAAKSKKSPAHNAFEWDNNKAANEYRLWQARQYIKRITIIYEEQEEKLFNVPIKMNSDEYYEDNKEGEYKPISLMEKDEFTRTLKMAIGQLKKSQENVNLLNNYLKDGYKKKGAQLKIKKANKNIKNASIELESI